MVYAKNMREYKKEVAVNKAKILQFHNIGKLTFWRREEVQLL